MCVLATIEAADAHGQHQHAAVVDGTPEDHRGWERLAAQRRVTLLGWQPVALVQRAPGAMR